MNRFYTTFILTLLFCLGAQQASAQCTNLFFSEYIEGSSNNKLIEIYNPTPNAVDLSNYQLAAYNNGGTDITNSLEWPAGTMLASGDVYIVGNPGADSVLLAQADTTSSVTFFNGDDAIVLRDTTAGMDLDIIGVVGEDPGTAWTVGSGSTANHTLVRRSSVNEGETNWSVAVLGWISYDINFSDSLGFHNIDNCDSQVEPIASFVTGSASAEESVPRDTAWVTLSDIDQAYDIQVSISGGDAFSPLDFVLVNGTGIYPISMGQELLAIPFEITDDMLAEDDEFFEITISEMSGNVTIVNATYTYTILDNDNPATPPCEYPFFSEYLEGSSNNKVLEVFNPTNAAIDLSDFRINRYNNGNDGSVDTSGVFYWPEGTMLGSKEVYVIANPSADSNMLAVSDTTSDITFYNGDDALELEVIEIRMAVDVIGRIGEDPGTNWPVGTGATSEYTLVRDPDVQGGQTNWALAAETWLVYEQNFADSLGGHYMVPCGDVDPCDTTDIQIDGAVLHETVQGAGDGAINLTITGNGVMPLEFSWTGPDAFSADTEDIDNLAPGEYCVIVTDANDCQEDACFTVDEGTGPCDTITLFLSAVVMDESADGADDGSIDLTVSGNGIMPFDYQWNNGAITEDLSGLPDGEYCVLVTDFLGCNSDTCFTVERGLSPCDTTDIELSADVTDESEIDAEDGAIDLTVSGNGTGPFDFTWSGPDGFSAVTEDINNLAPGTYSVLVEDANGCLEDASFIVGAGVDPCDGVNIEISFDVTDESSPGAEDGAIDATVTGGTEPYTYSWASGQDTEDISGLAGGSYVLMVTDADGCTGTDDVSVGTGTGVNEIPALKVFDVYPNPARDRVNVNLRFDRTLEVQISVSDLSGRIVMERMPVQMRAGSISITPDWPAGIYFLKIHADDSLAVEPLIIVE